MSRHVGVVCGMWHVGGGGACLGPGPHDWSCFGSRMGRGEGGLAVIAVLSDAHVRVNTLASPGQCWARPRRCDFQIICPPCPDHLSRVCCTRRMCDWSCFGVQDGPGRGRAGTGRMDGWISQSTAPDRVHGTMNDCVGGWPSHGHVFQVLVLQVQRPALLPRGHLPSRALRRHA
jgi:hypothetical protein